ncbi:hypothetical protein [Sphingorhabdus contaminans]|uniref:hypothetical protein n=1 Tax=Sphingorhabdus contaminans TaxID=1343899 RepID=UPI003D2855C0
MRNQMLGVALSMALFTDPAVAFDSNRDTAANDPDQVIKCRKVEVTGSLLKKGKVCRTVAEWRRIMENGNRTARAVIEEGAKPTN